MVALGQLQHVFAERAGLLEEEGGGRLGPDDELRPARRRGPRQVAIARHGLALVGGVPLVVLLDVPLRDRHPEASRRGPLRDRGSAPLAGERHGDDERRQHEQRREDATLPHAACREHRRRYGIEEDEQRGDAVDAGHLDHLHEGVMAVLGVAERRPRKADEEPGAQPFERHPERGRDPERRDAPLLEPAEAAQEGAVVAGENARHEDEDADRERQREGRVVGDRVGHPVDGGEVEDEASGPAERERGTRPAPPRGQQERHEADPRQRLEVEGGEGRCQEEPAGHREEESAAPPGLLRGCHLHTVGADRYRSHRSRVRARRAIRSASAAERS